MDLNSIIGTRNSSQDNSALTVRGAKVIYFPLAANRSMQGNLNMGGNAITNIRLFVEDDVINYGYFHTQRGELKRLITIAASDCLNREDPDPMQDYIDMANHSIINLKDPQPHDSFNAVTVYFVNKTINDNNATI